jgi:N-acetylglutamate synthase-like GNAT family acetyltransferase
MKSELFGKEYVFREIRSDEIDAMFSLIMSRVHWMDEVGIRQWNVTKYGEVYPPSYYESHAKDGEVFVLAERATDKIVSAAVLKREDDRWPCDGARALYLHNFASDLGAKGVGSLFLELAEEHAREQGMEYFRLDSADDNQKLEQYYTERGYVAVGTCVDGLYSGILRQKKI